MIKPIRPPFFLIFGALFGIIVLLTGGAFWKIRRSPDFYERRADKLVELGNHLLASRQYAVAAQRTEDATEKAWLVTKHCEELAKSDRVSLEEEFKDYFNARDTLLKTVHANPGSLLPVEVSLRFFYQLAALSSPESQGWDDLQALMTLIEETKTGGEVLERYKALYRFRECLIKNNLAAEPLSSVVEDLENNQPQPPDFDADFHFNLNLARLYLANALSESEPGRAYSLHQQGTAPPAELANDAVNVEGIANQAALMIISELFKSDATNQRYRDLEVTALNVLERAGSPLAQVSFAKQLLVTSLYPPLNELGTGEGTPTHTALKVLNKLSKTRKQETLTTWLLLNFVATEDARAREKALLATIRANPDAEKGLLGRFVNFKLRMRAAQSHILQLLDNLDKQHSSQQYDDMLEEAKDEVDFLATLEFLGMKDTGVQSAFLEALVNRYGLEKRRALVELREVDQLFTESNALVKLQMGVSLAELGESGAALEELKRAWNLKQQLPLADRLTICDLICQALIRTGEVDEAERIITSLIQVNNPPPTLWWIAGRTFRRLADSPAVGSSGKRDECEAKAMTCLLAATAELPEDYRGWFELGLLHRQQGDFQQAEINLKEALKRQPRHWGAARVFLQLLMGQKRFPEAVQLVNARLSQAKDSRIEQLVKTLLAEVETKPDTLLTAMDLLPPGGLAQRLALHNYYWRTDNPKADDILRELESEHPNHERVVSLKYNHLLKANDHQAIDRLVDNNQRPLALKSLQYVLKGEHELYFQHPYSALASFQQALKNDPWNSHTWGLLSRAQEEAMLPEKAIESLRRAIQINPANMNLKLALHLLLNRSEKTQTDGSVLTGITREKQAGSISGGNPLVLYLAETGQLEALYSMREKRVQDDPMDERNARQLAFMDLMAGNTDKAEKRLRELTATGLAATHNHLALAMFLERTRDKRAAVDYVLHHFGGQRSELTAEDSLAVGQVLNYLGDEDAAGRFFAAAASRQKKGQAKVQIAWEYIRWLLAGKEVETAFEQAREVLSSQTDPTIFTRIGNLFAINGLYQQTLDLLANAPQTVGTLDLIGGSRYALNDIEGARKAFDQASQRAPEDPRPHILRAKLMARMSSGDYLREAELGYETAISLQPDLPLPRVELVRLMEREGRYEEAERELTALVGKWPEREDFRLWQCENALRENQAESAATFIGQARNLRMNSPQWDYLGAKTAFLTNDFPEAMRLLVRGLSRFQTLPPFEFLVELLIREALIPEAEAVLNHLPTETNSPRLEVFRAVLADRQNQPEKCLSHLQSALEKLEHQPDDVPRDWLQQVLTARRIALLQQRIDNSHQLFLMLQCAWDAGAYRHVTELAEHLSRKIENTDPRWTSTRLTLANAYQMERQYRRAAKVYEELLKDVPKLRPAKNNLAYLYAVYLVRPEQAETLSLATLAGGNLSNATKAAYMDTLGLSYLYQQKYEQAVETLRDASKLLDSVEIRAHLGLAILKNGQPGEGRKRILKAWRQASSSEDYSAQAAETVLETMTMAGISITLSEKLVLCQKHLKEKRYARVRAIMRGLPPVNADPDYVLERAALLADLRELAAGRDLLNWARESDLSPVVKLSLATLFNDSLPEESQSIRVYLESQSSTPAAVLIDLGRQRMVLKEFAAAEKIFERLINSSSPPAEAVIGFLSTRLQTEASPLPNTWLETIGEKGPASAGIKCLWAASQRDHEAVSEFIRYVNNDPAIRPSDILAAGYFLLATERPDYVLIETLAVKALQMDAGNPSTWIFRAVVAEDGGNAEKAFEYLIQAVNQDPFNTTAVSLLGLKLAILNKAAELEKMLTTYALFYQEKAWFLVLRGEAARMRGDSEKAVKAFRQAFSLDASPDTLYRLTQLLLDTDQAGEAQQTLSRHETITRLSGPLLALWAKTRLLTGDLKAALRLNAQALNSSSVRDLNQVVEITAATCPPDSLGEQFRVFLNQAIPARQQEKFINHTFRDPEKRRSDSLKTLYADTPRGSIARRVLGLLLAQTLPKGSLAQTDLFDALIADYPRSPLVFERFADHLLKKEDPALLDEANLAASNAVRLAEEPGGPADKLADCLETLARTQIAMELINPAYRSILRAVKLSPDTGNIFLLAEILVKKDAWLAAEKELKRVEKLMPSHGDSISLSDIEALRKRIENRGKKSPVEP